MFSLTFISAQDLVYLYLEDELSKMALFSFKIKSSVWRRLCMHAHILSLLCLHALQEFLALFK